MILLINLLFFRDPCACYDHFFFSVFKLVLPPIMLKVSVDRKEDLEGFDVEEMEATVKDVLFHTGVEDLIHLIADEANRQRIEPEYLSRRNSKRYHLEILEETSNVCT